MSDQSLLTGNGGLFRVLSLDGGGSKGMYSIGVLKEVEASLGGAPLSTHFDLIFGTSTGAIIAALIGLGYTAAQVEEAYLELIPKVMGKWWRRTRSKALMECALAVFGERDFSSFQTRIGIVATDQIAQRPMIFKTHAAQAYNLKNTFVPGFGVSIADAIVASSAAFPFFKTKVVDTRNQGSPELLDGGFVANNPTLMAVADARNALGVPLERIRLLSIGVGHYKEPKRNWHHELLYYLWPFRIIQTMFQANTNTLEILRGILMPDLRCVRIDDSFTDSRYATDMLEDEIEKLRKLAVLGRESFRKREKEVRELLLSAE